MDRLRVLRNVAIVASIAAAVQFLPGGGRAAEAFAAALWVVFGAGLAFFGYRVYRERQVDLDGLGQRYRGLCYGALAAGFVTLAARARMWETGFGQFVWIVLICLCAYTLFAVYRFSRSY